MKRAVAVFGIAALLLPSFAYSTTCIERNEACSLGELMEISTNAQTIGLSTYEHIAVLLEIITHLRRIITTFSATSQVSRCYEIQNDLRPGASDATTDGEVSDLQFFLTAQHVYGGLITGFYGPQTAKAVLAWQKEQTIPDVDETTGVGKITREKIRLATCAVVQ